MQERDVFGVAGRGLGGGRGALFRQASDDGRRCVQGDNHGSDEINRQPLFARVRQDRASYATSEKLGIGFVFYVDTCFLVVSRCYTLPNESSGALCEGSEGVEGEVKDARARA